MFQPIAVLCLIDIAVHRFTDPSLLCDGIKPVIACQSVLHGKQAAAVPDQKRGNRLTLHMPDEFHQIHGTVEHRDPIFTVKIVSIRKYDFTL